MKTTNIQTPYGIFFLGLIFSIFFYVIMGSAKQFDDTFRNITRIISTTPQVAQVSSSLTNGLVGWWKFDETSGNSAKDSSGTGNNGTLVNGPVWSTDSRIGNGSLQFDGTNDWVDCGTNSSILPDVFSLSAWAKVTSGVESTLIALGDNSSFVKVSLNSTGGTYPRILLGPSNYVRFTPQSASSFPTDIWHHYVFIVTGNNQSDINNAKLYIDGISRPVNFVTDAGLPTSKSRCKLGNDRADVANITIKGSMDDVRLYNRVLTESEIQNLYNFTSPPADTEAPSISITSPLNGVNVLGENVIVSADAVDNVGVVGVQFKLDGSNVDSEDTSLPYSISLDSAQISNGLHSLTAVARDSEGNTVTSSIVSININNGVNDTIKPIVSMVVPINNSTVANTILLSATATDNDEIASLQFKIDGNNFGSVITSLPYKVSWDTTTSGDGSHIITAISNDKSGNSNQSQITVYVDNSNHWYSSFNPVRQFYISPTGTGNGSSFNSPMSLSSAMQSSVPGDLYWFLAGTYDIGILNFTKAGTKTNPIVYRAMPNQRVVLNGSIVSSAAYNWFWGFEITDFTAPDVNKHNDGFSASAPGVRAINNVIHDNRGNGIGAFNTGSDQVFYGNIVYEGSSYPLKQRGHNVYTQNVFSTNGYKYYINNILINPPIQACNFITNSSGVVTAASNCYAFHAYTQGGSIQGFNIQNNIIANGRFLIGGTNAEPADRNVVKNNYFYNTMPTFSAGNQAVQVEFKNNYVGRGNLMVANLWGEGETVYTQYAPNIFSNNQFYTNGNLYTHDMLSEFDFKVRTVARGTTGNQVGVPKIQKTDIVDDNIYGTSFNSHLLANNGSNSNYAQFLSLSAWQTATGIAGNSFDLHSRTVSFPPANNVAVIPNEYEPGRAHVAIYNWSKNINVSANLSSVLTSGSSYFIYSAKDMWGIPLVSGTYSGGDIIIPTGGAEFMSLVVVSVSGTISPTQTLTPTQNQTPTLPLTTNPINTTVEATSTTPNNIPPLTPPPSSITFTLTQSSPLVRLLQQTLNNKGYLVSTQGAGSKGQETLYFGQATQNALKKYQCTVIKRCSGSSHGVLDEVTATSLGITLTTVTTTTTFTRNLTLGSRGDDVKALQIFLNTKGFTVSTTGAGSKGQETTYFGLATKAALAKFQASNGITPAVGYFGPVTRGRVNGGL